MWPPLAAMKAWQRRLLDDTMRRIRYCENLCNWSSRLASNLLFCVASLLHLSDVCLIHSKYAQVDWDQHFSKAKAVSRAISLQSSVNNTQYFWSNMMRKQRHLETARQKLWLQNGLMTISMWCDYHATAAAAIRCSPVSHWDLESRWIATTAIASYAHNILLFL